MQMLAGEYQRYYDWSMSTTGENLTQRFVRNLDVIRSARGLSADAFSRLTQLSRQHLCVWRTGKTQASLAVLERTADRLGVDPASLLAKDPADALR